MVIKFKKNKLNYKLIKNNKKKIFPLGLGCGIGNYNTKYSYNQLNDAIKGSLKLGVNFFDTAPIYGEGVSEKILGSCISPSEKDKVLIATKISPEMLSRECIIKSVNQSRKNLKLDILDLVQVHWPNPKIDLFETMDTLLKLKENKIISSLGLCNYSLNDTKKIVKKYGKNFISTFQTEYNLFDRTADGAFYNFLLKNKITLLAYSPLAQGKIYNGAHQKEILEKISDKYNITVAQLILKWLSQKKNIIAIPNSLNKKRIIENYKSPRFKITQKDLNIIENRCKTKIEMIETKKIIIANKYNLKVYRTLKEAKINKFQMVPSPINLSFEVQKTKKIKPIRIKQLHVNKKKKIYLIEGRLRFWAWILAFGWDKKVPSLIWHNITTK